MQVRQSACMNHKPGSHLHTCVDSIHNCLSLTASRQYKGQTGLDQWLIAEVHQRSDRWLMISSRRLESKLNPAEYISARQSGALTNMLKIVICYNLYAVHYPIPRPCELLTPGKKHVKIREGQSKFFLEIWTDVSPFVAPLFLMQSRTWMKYT